MAGRHTVREAIDAAADDDEIITASMRLPQACGNKDQAAAVLAVSCCPQSATSMP